ncbi:MAG TPA: type II/IV secretion system ATPase subunit [archaeon]|nr:type II/IV secretion system ATPase subunit [archaeon]
MPISKRLARILVKKVARKLAVDRQVYGLTRKPLPEELPFVGRVLAVPGAQAGPFSFDEPEKRPFKAPPLFPLEAPYPVPLPAFPESLEQKKNREEFARLQREVSDLVPEVKPLDVGEEAEKVEGEQAKHELSQRISERLKKPIPGVQQVEIVAQAPESTPVRVEMEGVLREAGLGTEVVKAAAELARELGGTPGASGKITKLPELKHALPERFLTEIESAWKPPILTQVNERYSLISPFAYAQIRWEPREESLHYYIIEPTLNEDQLLKLKYIKELLSEYLNINLYEVQDVNKIEQYLRDKVDELISKYVLELSDEEKSLLGYFISRDLLGLDKIEPLLRDESIEDISCIGIGLPIYIFHRKYGSIRTNVAFETEEELNKFLVKIAQKCGRTISVAHPLLDGSLQDGSRVQATYSSGADISMKGSTFTIRKFTKDPFTVTDLMNFGTIPPIIGAYLWLAVEHRNSLLMCGGTASGKTVFLNVVSLFIPPESKIVSIEDTAELRLPHENWVPKVARAGTGPTDTSGRRMGEVSLFDLLKASFRERPDYLVVGEVRGEEAYVLFQLMASGHPGMATIHAEDFNSLVHRLTTKPLNLSAGLLQSLDVVCFMESTKVKGVEVRRVKEVVEIAGIDLKNDRPIANTIFKWDAATDSFKFVSDKSYVLNKIIELKGVSEGSLWEELERRTEVLDWLRNSNTRYYTEVAKILAAYYKDPEKLLERLKI